MHVLLEDTGMYFLSILNGYFLKNYDNGFFTYY
jgi:hypothetical protein